jgi:hypothetical protein
VLQAGVHMVCDVVWGVLMCVAVCLMLLLFPLVWCR